LCEPQQWTVFKPRQFVLPAFWLAVLLRLTEPRSGGFRAGENFPLFDYASCGRKPFHCSNLTM
ncbi:MAG TPA: hypothetical protein VH251_10935, partial [Verrucomicrobiae bacterium]|nr:hypothetical protein [Verrucomicrobiae bacterium]